MTRSDRRRRLRLQDLLLLLLLWIGLCSSFEKDEQQHRDYLKGLKRIVYSFTTTQRRIDRIRETLDSIVSKQTVPVDAVLLNVGPDIVIPEWLLTYAKEEERLKIVRMKKDYGPASKLLGALNEGNESGEDTLIVFGDDDIVVSPKIVQLHIQAQDQAKVPTAFGTRRIHIGHDLGIDPPETVLEATGTISVRASFLPREATEGLNRAPDACRLSDDYWISHFLTSANVRLEELPSCVYSWSLGRWPADSCGSPFYELSHLAGLGALSQVRVTEDGILIPNMKGDWRDQLARYALCRSLYFNPPDETFSL